jgi:dTDP-4-amino-4,6-dideoxygalactose transaminase
MTFIPVLRPRVADADTMLPYIRMIDEARCYTNHGPQERMLRAQFANMLGDRSMQDVSLFSSGTTALVAAMQAWELPAGSKCLVPAWTFVGSACAVVQAGLEPVIVDVDPHSWIPDLTMIEDMARTQGLSAALIVSPFGATIPYEQLVDTQDRTGIRILVDGAASFDFVQKLAQARTTLPIPIMVSLHATKLVSAIEGGLILVSDTEATRKMIAWSNFGIFDQNPVTSIGTNAKLSEIHATYGQHSLADWPYVRQHLSDISESYVQAIGARLPDYGYAPNIHEGLISSSFNIVLPEPSPELDQALAAAGIETRRWWKRGVHRFLAFQRYAAGPLAVTEDLAERAIGLPFHYGVTSDVVEKIVTTLEGIREGRLVAAR